MNHTGPHFSFGEFPAPERCGQLHEWTAPIAAFEIASFEREWSEYLSSPEGLKAQKRAELSR